MARFGVELEFAVNCRGEESSFRLTHGRKKGNDQPPPRFRLSNEVPNGSLCYAKKEMRRPYSLETGGRRKGGNSQG